MNQINRKFVSYVLPVLVGITMIFPNKDGFHHHIYSFSKAKKFERSLYKGTDVEPIVCDQVGIVKLECNIHDWMSAITFVLQNLYFQLTGEQGKYAIPVLSSKENLRHIPPGKYKLVV